LNVKGISLMHSILVDGLYVFICSAMIAFLVGHDMGAQIAYSYAAAHPTEVKRLVVSDHIFPGFAPSGD